VKAALAWLHRRTENVAAALLAAMFAAFLLQIVTRYVINAPLGWTLEVCLTCWLWLVFWGSAFNLEDHDHVKFDVIYVGLSRRGQRALALVSAVAIVGGFLAALPASIDYIAFYKIKRSATLQIRLDVVFSVYAVFALAVIARYSIRAVRLVRDGDAGPAAPGREQAAIE
jgi:TRAP-type C4-dicarboxylate transport system permease small subunit